MTAALATMPRQRHTFDATFEGAGAASAWLRDALSHEAPGDKLVFALEVCLEELFINVVMHGGPGRSAQGEAPLTVTLELEPASRSLELVIEDNGKPFDVSQALGRPISKPLEELVPGGLGMQLIRNFSSELLYEALPFGNRVIVKFLRQ